MNESRIAKRVVQDAIRRYRKAAVVEIEYVPGDEEESLDALIEELEEDVGE